QGRHDFGHAAAYGPDGLCGEGPDCQGAGLSMDAAEREKFAAFVLRMRALGIDRNELMGAVEATPRPAFVPAQWGADAWCDRSIPIECGQTIEGLDLQMKVLADLDLKPDSKVLEVGCGS